MTYRWSRPSWLGLICLALLLFLYAPLVVAVVYAFNSGHNLSWPPQGFSLYWFQTLFTDDLFRQALFTSVIAATVSSLLAGTIGTAAAIVITRRRSRLATVFDGLGRLPVMFPPLFIGIGIVAAMEMTRIDPSIFTIILGHTTLALPFVVIVVTARFRTFDLELELAARDLGAGPWQVLRRVTMPIVAPATVGAIMLAFAISFDEVLVTNFTSGTLSTVPIYVFAKLRRYIDPGANAVATILLLIPWIALGVGALSLRRSRVSTSDQGQELVA